MIETNNKSFFRYDLFGQLIAGISIVLIFLTQPDLFNFEGFNFLQSGFLILGAIICIVSTFEIIFSHGQKKKIKEPLDIKDLSESEQIKLLIKTSCFSLLAFAIAALFFYILHLDLEGKLNFIKDKLPLQKIEVLQIEGTITFENTNQYQRKYTYLRLAEFPNMTFDYVSDEKLDNELNLLSNEAILEPGEKIKLKIRKTDLEKLAPDFIPTKYSERLIRFYELTVENELLLRKKHITDAK